MMCIQAWESHRCPSTPPILLQRFLSNKLCERGLFTVAGTTAEQGVRNELQVMLCCAQKLGDMVAEHKDEVQSLAHPPSGTSRFEQLDTKVHFSSPIAAE